MGNINNEEETKTKKRRLTLEEIDDKFETSLDDLKNEIKSSFEIDEFSLVEENMKTISKMHFYVSKLAEEKKIGVRIERIRMKKHGELYEKYKTGAMALSKYEIEEWINKNPDYQIVFTYSEQQKIIIDYLTRLVESLKQKLYALKNIQEMKKIGM
jgi:hypothetical protein